MAAEHLVIVGKGGVGKSTTATNLAAALAEAGRRVVLIGYNRERTSTAALRGNTPLSPMRPGGHDAAAPLYAGGYLGTLCMETGAVDPEGGPARDENILDDPLVRGYHPDYVLHDLSEEPGAAFLLPAAYRGVVRALAVTSAGMGAIEAVNQLFHWLNTVAAADCRFGGVVVNNLSGPLYQSIITDFVTRTNTSIAATVPHSLMVSVSDFHNRTLLELAPLSHVSYAYRKLARTVIDGGEVRRPKYLESEALRRWALEWGEIVAELETGIVRDGGSI